MCGLLFLEQDPSQKVSLNKFNNVLTRQSWRGVDSSNFLALDSGRYMLGHNRLSIIDLNPRSNQPMVSSCGNYVLLYNGEIYNHIYLRNKIPVEFISTSDTETLLQGLIHEGESFISKIEGMFGFVFLDIKNNNWIAARDPFGIKPLFYFKSLDSTAVCSEAASLAILMNASPSPVSISEWKLIRRPLPGYSYFDAVYEVLPGSIIRSDGTTARYWTREQSIEDFNQEHFESLLRYSVEFHQLSDVDNVSMLSGGLDSGVITAISSVKKSYTVGLSNNNEFKEAQETADILGRDLVKVNVSQPKLFETWAELVKIRQEPLSVPNEALIYILCKSMHKDERVVLTGEGADELLFGYDQIYRWSTTTQWHGASHFLNKYGYSATSPVSDRLNDYIENLKKGKSVTDFVEDFFIDVHLPCLLRRMDFASMAASKEARVPFVCKSLINYMYRRPDHLRINLTESKLPLRSFALKLGLSNILNRKKIGFSARHGSYDTKTDEYHFFQNLILKELGW